MRIGIVLFDGVEELDAVGPWEVFGAWADRWPDDGVEVISLAPTTAPVQCAKGLRVLADHTWDAVPALDLVLYPGGIGTRSQLGDDGVRKMVRDFKAAGALMTSVCTGALIYADAGLLAGRPATTHWGAFDLLRKLDPSILLRPNERFVDDGDIVTAAGVSAGIDMALHLVARLASQDRARDLGRYIQYEPTPGA